MAEPLKHQIGTDLVRTLSTRFAMTAAEFDATGFERRVLADLDALGLKARVDLIADELHGSLPGAYPEALALVVEVSSQLEGFDAWPLCTFVERHGVDEPQISLAAMELLTRRMSCEFAVRPFLDRHLDLTREHLRRWTASDDERVRRLPSEGTRPHLPWGRQVAVLLEDPQIGLELLERLRHDPSSSVRRSVANHLNDVARRHPGLVVDTVERWQAEDPPVDAAMCRHAMRALVKRGDPRALRALGYTADPAVDVVAFAVRPGSVRLGARVMLRAEIRSTSDEPQRLVVDFVVHHRGRYGATNAKVFKWATVDLGAGESVELTKGRLIDTASTRRYLAGWHRVDLQISGHVLASSGFELTDSSTG